MAKESKEKRVEKGEKNLRGNRAFPTFYFTI